MSVESDIDGVGLPTSDAATTPSRALCDAVDRQLITLLLKDVHSSNRKLARVTGLSEWVVANRLRRLRENNVFAATLVMDWRLIGYQVSGFALLRLDRARIAEVTGQLEQRADAQSVTRTLGAVDLVVHLLGRDLAALRQAADEIGALAGVTSLEQLVIVDYHRYVFDRTPLPLARWNPEDYAETTLPLDALDRRMMGCLIEDGHQSNREIARQLGVTENTIRMRWRRLEQSGLVRVITMFDPFAFGEAVIGYFALRTRDGSRRRLVERLTARTEVAGLMSCLGSYDLVGVAVTDSLRALANLMEDLHSEPGVDSLVQLPIVGTPMYRVHLARLLMP
jgi:DNA-binding Lrp family transcriptional regulator